MCCAQLMKELETCLQKARGIFTSAQPEEAQFTSMGPRVLPERAQIETVLQHTYASSGWMVFAPLMIWCLAGRKGSSQGTPAPAQG